MKYYEPMIAEVIKRYGLERHEAHLKPGQAFIWAANLLHGGSPILEPDRTRHSQVTHYLFEDCLYYTPLHSDPAIGKMFYRNPINIATGELAGNRYCGSDFAVSRSEPEPGPKPDAGGLFSRVFKRKR